MYNNDLKVEFIRQKTRNINTADFYQAIFNRFSEFEERAGLDICLMSTEQLQDALESTNIMKASSISAYLLTLKEYAKWCVENGIQGATLNILHVDDPSAAVIKKRMVSSPVDLQSFLDSVYDKEEKETTDNIYRAYFWLAFCGVQPESVFALTSDDVDCSNGIVFADWKRYKVYKEGIKSIKNCATLQSFVYLNANYKNAGAISRPRIDGEHLLRGVRGTFNEVNANVLIQRAIVRAKKSGKTSMSPTYQTVWLSGQFFRIYQKELVGVEVDFIEIAGEIMRSKKRDGTMSSRRRLRDSANHYRTEYNKWKSAFNL